EHHRVDLVLVHLADPRVDVPAEGVHLQMGPAPPHLRHAPQAARSKYRALGQLLEAAAIPRDDAVPDVLTCADCADRDPRRILRREVLQRVHGQIDLSVLERALELRREEALAADLGEWLAARLRTERSIWPCTR